jgi:hypothetical protein
MVTITAVKSFIVQTSGGLHSRINLRQNRVAIFNIS